MHVNVCWFSTEPNINEIVQATAFCPLHEYTVEIIEIRNPTVDKYLQEGWNFGSERGKLGRFKPGVAGNYFLRLHMLKKERALLV